MLCLVHLCLFTKWSGQILQLWGFLVFAGFIENQTFCSLREWLNEGSSYEWSFLKTNLFHCSLSNVVFLAKMQFWLNINGRTWGRGGQQVGFVAEQVALLWLWKSQGLSNYSCSSFVMQGTSNIPLFICTSNDILLLIAIYCRQMV